MEMSLSLSIGIFVASAVAVIYFGSLLAKYGDALATLTGWGRLFVGSLLVALATSLPELSTNISAVRLATPNPELALGDVFGSNMANMFILAVVALMFGGKRFLQKVAPEQGYLIVLAAIMTALAVLFATVKIDISVWQIGISSIILLIVYVIGMKIVYSKRPEDADDEELEDPGITLTKAWVMFGIVAAGVIIASFFLAFSVDRIAELTGVASSTLGILSVAVVTSMPEVAASIAAARMGAADLGIGNLYGSCVFNVTILCYADPFYRQGILVNQSDPNHLIAGVVALILILMGLLVILGRDKLHKLLTWSVLALMAAIYIAGAVAVARLGAPHTSTASIDTGVENGVQESSFEDA